MTLPLDEIVVDRELQQRVTQLDDGVVAEYAAAMRDGATFPPLEVVVDGEA